MWFGGDGSFKLSTLETLDGTEGNESDLSSRKDTPTLDSDRELDTLDAHAPSSRNDSPTLDNESDRVLCEWMSSRNDSPTLDRDNDFWERPELELSGTALFGVEHSAECFIGTSAPIVASWASFSFCEFWCWWSSSCRPCHSASLAAWK